MIASAERHRLFWFVLAIAYFIGGYFLCVWLVGDRVVDILPIFSWEQHIPLIPEAVFGYMLIYPTMILAYFKTDEHATYYRLVRHMFILLSCHYVLFLLLPMTMERPILATEGNLALEILRIFYEIDPPHNLFPSIHVSLPLLASLGIWRYRPIWGMIFMIVTIIVIGSVLLIKQHYAVDVLGAIALVLVVLSFPRRRKFRSVNLDPRLRGDDNR
jgi:membrane-associated phospholipid phosphatase